MAVVVGSVRGEEHKGRTGSDHIDGRGGADTIIGNEVGGRELLVGGSFESAKVSDGRWGGVQNVGGWRTDTTIEVWGKGFLGVNPTDGNKVVELDSDRRASRLWQDVQTEEGKPYAFSFDFSARAGTALSTNTIEVYWNDKLVGTFDPKSAVWEKGQLELIGTGGLDRLEFRESAGDNDSLGGLIDNVSLREPGDGRDELIGGAGADTVIGGGGDDIIYGGGRPSSGGSAAAQPSVAGIDDNDSIIAGAGNDIAYGNHGDDVIHGNEGNDRLLGGRGDDGLYGGTGNDTLYGNSGHDKLSDGSGDDLVYGGSGNDIIIAGTGADRYIGGTGHDILTFVDATTGVRVDMSKHLATGMGRDVFYGIEQIEGSRFDDSLKGSKGDETLSGGAGNDLIRGLSGTDVLIGGEGSDTFIWKLADLKRDMETGAVDVIKDMSEEDRIDLRDFSVGMTLDASMFGVKFDGTNTHIFADLGNGMQEFAMLENFKAESFEQLVKDGIILT